MAGRPSTLPGIAGTRPVSLPGQGGVRPGLGGGGTQWTGGRPGAGSGFRPGDGLRPSPGGLIGPGTRPGQGGSGTQWAGGRPGGGSFRPGDSVRPGQGGSGTQWAGWRPGGGSFRPGDGLRPGQGGSGTQWPGWRPGGDGFRPGDGLRPGQGGSGTQWAGWRPGDGRPGYGDRPRPGGIIGSGNIGSGNIGNIGSGANVGSGNTIINRPDNSVTNVANSANYSNVNVGGWGGGYGGAWGGGYYGGGYNVPSYYPSSYGSWFSGSWSNWPSYPVGWLGGAAAGWLGATVTDSSAYSNPYYAEPAQPTVVQSVYNYAQPIPVYTEPQATTVVVNASPAEQPTSVVESLPGVIAPAEPPPAAQPPEQPPEDPKVKEAVGLFDEARALFKAGDYAGAQAKVEKAIGVMPQDRVLHEFRALVLFADKKYKDAAATLYAVLAAGPGWNWDTLKTLYPDTDTYTRQLRELETHARNHPEAAEDRFVLAYHYFVLDQLDAAIKALEQVTALQPSDQLSAQLVKALKFKPADAGDRPAPGTG
jgi:hypothetical protein